MCHALRHVQQKMEMKSLRGEANPPFTRSYRPNSYIFLGRLKGICLWLFHNTKILQSHWLFLMETSCLVILTRGVRAIFKIIAVVSAITENCRGGF